MHLSMDIFTPPCACGAQRTSFEVSSLLLPSESQGLNSGSLLLLRSLAGLISKHLNLNSHLTVPSPSFLVTKWKRLVWIIFSNSQYEFHMAVISKSSVSPDLINHQVLLSLSFRFSHTLPLPCALSPQKTRYLSPASNPFSSLFLKLPKWCL